MGVNSFSGVACSRDALSATTASTIASTGTAVDSIQVSNLSQNDTRRLDVLRHPAAQRGHSHRSQHPLRL